MRTDIGVTHLGHHADNEALLLNVVRFDRVGILKDLAYSTMLTAAAVHVSQLDMTAYRSRSASAGRHPILSLLRSWPSRRQSALRQPRDNM